MIQPTERQIQRALADFVFSAVRHAVDDMPNSALDDAHEPLEDTILEMVQYSDYHCLVKVTGHGKIRWFDIKVHRDSVTKTDL